MPPSINCGLTSLPFNFIAGISSATATCPWGCCNCSFSCCCATALSVATACSAAAPLSTCATSPLAFILPTTTSPLATLFTAAFTTPLAAASCSSVVLCALTTGWACESCCCWVGFCQPYFVAVCNTALASSLSAAVPISLRWSSVKFSLSYNSSRYSCACTATGFGRCTDCSFGLLIGSSASSSLASNLLAPALMTVLPPPIAKPPTAPLLTKAPTLAPASALPAKPAPLAAAAAPAAPPVAAIAAVSAPNTADEPSILPTSYAAPSPFVQ